MRRNMQLSPRGIGLWLLVIVYLGFGIRPVVLAHGPVQGREPIVVHLFWGDGCPHCEKAKPFLEELSKSYPGVEIRDYEVWYSPENQELFREMAAALDFEPRSVPTIFVGEHYWVGFNEQVESEIEAYVSEASAELQQVEAAAGSSDIISIPFVGPIDLGSQSLAVSTALVAFVDGFNPCSLWVLSMLMALTLHTGSRRKVFLIGLVFITITAAVYVLFIAGLFTMFTIVSFMGWIQVVVALLSLFFAAVNIKDYFWYQRGVSFTIADEKKPGIYKRTRDILNASQSYWGLVSATVVMASGVSLVEFSCTAGFPVLWTNLLAAQQVPPATFALLLLLYMIIYQIDELGIFLAAVFTLKSNRLEEKHGRILKLIGGILMLTLALVMIVDPALMNNLRSALLIFAAAFGAAMLVLLLHRNILPRLGVRVGTETAPQPTKKRRRRKRSTSRGRRKT